MHMWEVIVGDSLEVFDSAITTRTLALIKVYRDKKEKEGLSEEVQGLMIDLRRNKTAWTYCQDENWKVFTLRHLDNMTRDLEKWWVNERKSRVPSIDEAATVVARVMSRHLGCERLVEDMVDAEIAGVIRFEIGGGNSAQ